MPSIGFRTAGFQQWPIGQALAELGRIGYDGVEVCLEHPDCRPETLTAEGAEALVRLCIDVGLEVASASYHADFEPPDERRENTIRAVELVRPLGAELLIINGRRCEAGRESEAREELARLLEALLPRAEALQVGIAIEPEPGLAVGSSEEMRALIERTQSDWLGVNLDVGHAFLTDPDVCESIARLGASIFHTHIEGMPKGEHKHLLPGEGDLDLPAVLQALDKIAYGGYLTVDLFAIADDPLRWAERALSGMRSLLPDSP